MKYFLDTEFSEGFKKPIKWLPTIGSFNKPYHSIDLISIGIVCQDGREYYAISKDFDLKAAWDNYWLFSNVLKPIFSKMDNINSNVHLLYYSKCKKLLKKYGKTNKQIAEEIFRYVQSETIETCGNAWLSEKLQRIIWQGYTEPEFYAYFADYDWVVFCSLFGTMMDLPKGFPMMCMDIEQYRIESGISKDELINAVPQQNEHNALVDARWNVELYNFLNTF